MSVTSTARRAGTLGEHLLARRLVTEEQLDEAQRNAAERGRSLGRVLIELGYVSEAGLVSILAEQLGLEFIDLSEASVDPQAVGLVAEAVARRHSCLPVSIVDDALVVAMADPANVVAVDDIRAMTKRDVRVIVATKADVMAAITRYYRMDRTAETLAEEVAAEQEKDAKLDLEAQLKTAGAEDAPIIKLVNLLITQAVSDRASDIHIEPAEKELRVRYRIDGVLHEVMSPPKSVQSGITSRLKIMADINIAERRIPQDGRISLIVAGKSIDIRVATLPTVWGEKLVLRILDKSSVLLQLQDLGFLPGNFRRFEEAFSKPYGEILVTGPTGSGKSTTLYATLNILNKAEVNTITVEDPVEYRLPGVNQVQTHPKAGLTFASALRSILRADPDIVLIGEIRDRETAQIATEAALTGHLVLSTLHTNDAPSALTRLVEMGIEPYLVASALDCILAQRLARKLCGRCKEPYTPTVEELTASAFPFHPDGDLPEIFRATGCSACGKTGYKGRMALHEVMTVTEDIEKLVVESASSEVIKKTALQQGMITLREDGMEKVRMGQTSIEEILRVVV
ncbi:MAG: Flp pilus assembly complex ATPase component TadA [Actinomycetota bacterium]|nr:Flp pilus assembly complex ATPase component TadA [Actinomycetota bacterium]